MTSHFAIALVLFGLALTAQEPDASTILRQVAQTYQEVKSQSVEATFVLDRKTSPMRIEIPISGTILKPGRVRLEVNSPMMGSQTISDGRSTWMYVARFQQYTRKPVSPGIFPMSDGPGDIFAGENILDRLKTAKLLRQERLSVDGREIDCDVVQAEYSPRPGDQPRQTGPKTFWVDRRRSIILKTSSLLRIDSPRFGGPLEMTQSITVTSIKLDGPLPDSLFVFVPPEGAREVDEIMPPGMKAPGK